MSSSRNPLAVLRSLPSDGSCDDVRDGALREAGLQRAARRFASPSPSPSEASPGAGREGEEAPGRWRLPELSGRLGELCAGAAGASLTLAFALVLDAQRRAEPVAWLMDEQGGFFPPDAAEGGVDL